MNREYLIAIGFKLLNCLLFPVMSLVMLQCIKTIPLMQVFFIQMFLGSIISYLYLQITKQNISLKMDKKDYLLYLARAIANYLAIYLWIFSLAKLGLNEATALGYTGPLWVFLMARYIIGEKFSMKVFFLIAINILGMLIILEPKYVDISWQGAASALGAILLWSIYEIICKKQTSNQHYMLQTFYFMSISTMIMAPLAISNWQAINLQEASMLLLIALIAVTNITVIFIAYSFAPITLLSPFSYARLLFTVFLTAWIQYIVPNNQIFIGAAIIMFANIYFTYNVNFKRH
jgi:drug/metabolite transporter (DMT)-like permease